MNLQDNDTMQLGSLIQQQIVVHMARFDKALAMAARTLTPEQFPWNPGAVLARVLLDYYGRYGSRPPFQILATEIRTLLQWKPPRYLLRRRASYTRHASGYSAAPHPSPNPGKLPRPAACYA